MSQSLRSTWILSHRISQVLLIVLTVIIFKTGSLPALADSQKRVLLLLSYHPHFPTFFDQITGVQAAFEGQNITLDIEFMDTKRFNDAANLTNFYNSLAYKLARQQPYDVIITADDNALTFALNYSEELFAGVPIVFFGVNNLDLALAQNENELVTGVVEAVSMRETIALMEQLSPEAQTVYVIVDNTLGGQGDLQTLLALAPDFPNLTFNTLSLTEMTFVELATALRQIDANTPVLLLAAYEDRDGVSLSFEEGLQLVTENLNAPLYHLWYHGMGDGLLGGKLISHFDQGRMAASLALKILQGTPPSALPVVQESPNTIMFDYEQMVRFGIRPSDLPDDAIIINQPESFYARYRSLVWMVSIIFVILFGAVISLAVVMARRRKAEQQLAQTLVQLTHTQEQLIQHERLAAVGQLSAGIAHDFNNILASITLYADLAARSTGLSGQLRERMETIVRQAERGAALVQQILDFGRRAVIDVRPLNLSTFLQDLVNLLRRTLPENINVIFTQAVGDFFIEADSGRIQQAILNLAFNACNAMPDGGTLHITLAMLPPGSSVRCFCCEQPPVGHWIRVSVADSGTGIPDNVLPHIFEPFYTTRAPMGSGLGLAQVYGIMKQHQGHIAVETAVGAGATFSLFWQALPSSSPEPPTTIHQVQAGHQETILVVEDDAEVRAALLDILEVLNYQPLAAANGREALHLIHTHDQDIALIVCDRLMPVMGGLELAQELVTRRLPFKMLMLTGHPLDEQYAFPLPANVVGWLQKPLDMEMLAQGIARALRQPVA